MEPLEGVREAVTDVVILSGSKKDRVPDGYKRLPLVSGRGYFVFCGNSHIRGAPLSIDGCG